MRIVLVPLVRVSVVLSERMDMVCIVRLGRCCLGKMRRKVMRYSPSAGKHTVHAVERVKKRRASELKWGQRRFRKATAGYRGFPRPKPSGEKPTKRVNLLYRCTETGKAHQPAAQRAKKFKLIEK